MKNTDNRPAASRSLTNQALMEEDETIDFGYDHETQVSFEYLKSKLGEATAKFAIDYGFYEYKHQYWVARGRDIYATVSNFTIQAKYLIDGAQPRRIVTITNKFGAQKTLDLNIEDLVSLERFKVRVESAGNFVFEGKATDLTRIKSVLYLQEQVCVEVARLGWNPKGQFYAWANGIYTGDTFIAVNDNGMVEYDNRTWYIPILGATQAHDDEDLRNYRKFLHTESNISANKWATMMHQVYGDNAIIGIGFAMFSLYSSHVFSVMKGAPMLFLYGQRGSGKGTMATSLMHLFGVPQDPVMLGGSSTIIGFMRKLGQFADSIVWFDEYKNDIGTKPIESLKNIWDRIGRERGVKDNSNRTQSTPVTSSAILSGQEMPNAEPALFSRVILLQFTGSTREQQSIDQFNALRALENNGVTNVALEILSHRAAVEEKFRTYYDQAAATLRAAFAEKQVIDRQINNYAAIVAMAWILCEPLQLPFDHIKMLRCCEKAIDQQLVMMSTADECRGFFEMVAFLLSTGEISNGKDILITKNLVKIRMSVVFPLYKQHAKMQSMRSLDRGTLENYLRNSIAYDETESKKGSHRFPSLHSPTTAFVFLQAEVVRVFGVNLQESAQLIEDQQDTPISDENAPY